MDSEEVVFEWTVKRWCLDGQWRGGVWMDSEEVVFGLTVERWCLDGQ